MRFKQKGTFFIAVLTAALALCMFAPAPAGARPPSATGLAVGLPDSSTGGCLKLEWNVSGVGDVTAYRVYRSLAPDSGFIPVFEGEVNARNCGNMDYVDIDLPSGATFYYRVALIDRRGKETAPSNVARGTVPRRDLTTGGMAGKQIVISINDQRPIPAPTPVSPRWAGRLPTDASGRP